MIKRIILSFYICLIAGGLLAQKDTLYYDGFINNASGWPESNDGVDLCYIRNGVMRLGHFANDGINFSQKHKNFREDKDFTLEASFSTIKAGEFGFIWGAENPNNAYYFLITASEFRIFRFESGKSETLRNYTFSSLVNPRKNILSIERRNNTVNFLINRHIVHKETYDTLYGKSFGLSVWYNAEVDIDYFLLRQDQAPINLIPNISYKYKPEPLGNGVNTEYDDLGPIVSPDGKTLFFTRTRDRRNMGGVFDEEDIYYAIRENGAWTNPRNIDRPLNNLQPNAVCSVTPDGNTLLLINKYHPDGSSAGQGVSISRRTENGWSFPENLNIKNFYNESEYSEFCLSSDGNVLIMSIQRKDSYGDRDLYISFKTGETDWSEPVNLGNSVNTHAGEMSPFLAADGKTLYYSTSGYPTYGSNDIFISRRLDDTWKNWSKPQNLGKPINTEEWDAYYSLPASGEYAYFVSYEKSVGRGDIFRIKLPAEARPEPVVMIHGKVLDSDTKKPLRAKIIYESLDDGKELGTAWSSPETGEYKIVLPYGEIYGFHAEASKHIPVNENIDIKSKMSYIEIERDLFLSPIKLGQNIKLNNVFFKMASADLLETSYPELDRLVKIMKENPSLHIEISGHTDNIGNADNLLKVSELRVKSVKDYLVQKGIPSERITGKGYGGTVPVASNASEETRRLNRRVEFKITRF